MRIASHKLDCITGNDAAAWGARLARVKIVAAYPITPQTTVVERLADWIERGELDAQMIRVESEHSAMSACIGAAIAGVRVFTATSSHGLLYMYEMIWWAARSRAPVVMSLINRYIGPPWNIWSDWNDALSTRDSGWIQIWASTHQEILDSVIQAFKIAEDPRVKLPCMEVHGGMSMSHSAAPVRIWDQRVVDEFLPPEPPEPLYVFDPDVSEPITYGNIVLPDETPQHVWAVEKAMRNAKDVIRRVCEEFKELFGVDHGTFIQEYRTEDAEFIVFSMGDLWGSVVAAVDELRDKGVKVGACRIRVFRPFPAEEVARVADHAAMLFVVDRDISHGRGGILAGEVKAALYDRGKIVPMRELIVGLGGAEVPPSVIVKFVERFVR